MTVASPAEGAGDVDQHIGWNVHALLHRRHMNQKQLALALGVTPSVLSKKLRGESAWSARQVAATAEFFDIEPGKLYAKVSVAYRRADLSLVLGTGRGNASTATQLPLVGSLPTSHVSN